MATAKEIVTRVKQNIRLVARDEYRFDTEKNLVYSTHSWDCIELGTFKVNDFDKFFRLTVLNYQANQILDQIGVDNLKTYNSTTSKTLKLLMTPMENED